MSKSPARHRASLFRPLAAQVAAVLLITIAAVAGLAAPSSADDQTAEPGQTPAGEQTPGPDPAPETDSPARSDQAPEPDQTSDQATGQAPEQTAPAAPEPQDDLPASKPAPEKQAPKSEGPESEAPETNTPKKQEKSPAPTTRETTSLAPTGSTDKKVWICKYSSTPDDNERAQTVNSVAYNNNREPGTWGFEDAQGLTYVYAFDTGAASKPSKDDCPILVAPPTSPTWTDPTCANPMGSYQLAAYEETRATVSTSGSLEPGGTFTVTYTAIPPHQFINGNSSPTTTMSFSHTFPDLVGCPVVIKDLPTVTVDDPCGTADDSVTLSTSSQYTGKDNGDGTATFTAVPPNVFPGNESTYTVHYTPTTNEPCTVIINPATPQVSESTACDTPWQISIADTDHVTYAISPASSGTEATTVTITATPDAYFAFGATPGWTVNPDGTATFEHSFAAATSCLDVPAAPAPEAPTCFDDGWVLVPVPDHTTVTVNGDPVTSATVFGPGTYDVVYTAANGYVFTSGGNESTTKTYDDITVAAATGDCVIPAPAQPDSIDVCNPATVINNVEWKQPFPDLDNIAWSIDASTGDAVATAINGMAFADNTTTRRFTLPADNGIECTAPVAPTVTQSKACDIQSTLTIPDTPGIVYALDGDTIDAGTYDGPLSGTLTATAKTGFENTDPTWSFQVDLPTATACLEIPAQPDSIDPCNPETTDENVTWGTFPVLDDVEWSVDDTTGEAVATAINGRAFEGNLTEIRFSLPDDDGVACEMLPGDIESVCVDHIPYLRYAVGLPDDYVGPRDLTITFVNPDGADYVVADQPLAGRLLWPGASVNPPGWPGWVRNADGSYSKTSGNYAWTRDGVTVRFKVNPEYAVTVAYPQSTTACANPPQGPKADGPEPEARPETPNGVLPNTGAPANAGLAAMVGGLWLVLGAWLMLHTRRRHG